MLVKVKIFLFISSNRYDYFKASVRHNKASISQIHGRHEKAASLIYKLNCNSNGGIDVVEEITQGKMWKILLIAIIQHPTIKTHPMSCIYKQFTIHTGTTSHFRFQSRCHGGRISQNYSPPSWGKEKLNNNEICRMLYFLVLTGNLLIHYLQQVKTLVLFYVEGNMCL